MENVTEMYMSSLKKRKINKPHPACEKCVGGKIVMDNFVKELLHLRMI